MVGDQLPVDGGLVARPAPQPVGRDPQAASASAASTPVSRACPMPSPVSVSVAAAASPTNRARPRPSRARSMPGGDGPGLVGRLGPGVRAEHRPHVGPGQELWPQGLHVLGAPAAAPEDAEADVGPAVGERERPGVAGQEIGLEPHPQAPAGRAGRLVEVLAEGVPLAQVSGRGQPEELAEGRPHPVGADHVGRFERPQPLDVEADVVGRAGRREQPVAVVHLHAGRPGQVDQRRVEVHARHDGGEAALARGGAGTPRPGPTVSAPRRRRRPARREGSSGRGRAARAGGARRW